MTVSKRSARTLGWAIVALCLVVGVLGAAPFTPAVVLVALLLPAAAFVAWHGAVVAGLLSLVLCTLALAVSPLSTAQLFESPLAVAWLSLGSVAVVLGAVHGSRANGSRPGT